MRHAAGHITHNNPHARVQVGSFGGDNRAGIDATLHRIAALRNRAGRIVGLTCRVGRAVRGSADLVADLVSGGASVLFLGRPGVGKTTAIRELSRTMAGDLRRRVVIVDTSNEIGGDGDVAHAGIGRARRMQVRTLDCVGVAWCGVRHLHGCATLCVVLPCVHAWYDGPLRPSECALVFSTVLLCICPPPLPACHLPSPGT